MRVGLDLRGLAPAEQHARAVEADRLGLWGALVDHDLSLGALMAAEIATATTSIHLAVSINLADDHPFSFAEEVAVLDHLSNRRALVVVRGDDSETDKIDHLRRLLSGEIVDGVAIAPPPAQTAVPVWANPSPAFTSISLTGDLEHDRTLIDDQRDQGTTHLFVTWPGPPETLTILTRHLVTRAATPDFPQIVADWADRIEPI